MPWGALWLLGMTLAVMTALKIGLGRFPQVPSSVTPLELASSHDSIPPHPAPPKLLLIDTAETTTQCLGLWVAELGHLNPLVWTSFLSGGSEGTDWYTVGSRNLDSDHLVGPRRNRRP